MKLNLLATFALAFAAGLIPARAQINTGSDGHDGAFNPTQTTVIDMASHPDGICHLPAPTLRDTMQP